MIVEERGPWPFITHRVHQRPDGSLAVWSSRHHRKRLIAPDVGREIAFAEAVLKCLWQPGRLNWWIGTVFAVGSALFATASVLSLLPGLAKSWAMSSTEVNAVFFAGSIPFTTAAYLQLFQAANAPPPPGSDVNAVPRRIWIGWRPKEIGWLSCALQFVGTILFNFNTFDAMMPSLNWFQQDLLIWVPNFSGSVLFLTSGYLAFIETCHAHWNWQPRSLSWWVVFTNLLGCVGFMVAAVSAIYLPTAHPEAVTVSLTFTLLGAIGFLIGSLLMLPEAMSSESTLL